MVEGQAYEQGEYEEHYDDSQQAEYQEYQVQIGECLTVFLHVF